MSQTVCGVLAHVGLHLHAIAQQVIDGAVAVVEALAGVACRLVQIMQRPGDQRLVVTLLLAEKRSQQCLFDVAVAFAVGPVAEVVVAERVAEQLHHALLGLLFDLADGAHTRRDPPGQQFLHHALLEGAGLVAPLLQRRNLRVHVRQHGGDGGLFGDTVDGN